MNYYFVFEYYAVSGRPKAEEAVMKYAIEKYLYCLVADYMLEDIQMDLERQCMKIREENRRISGVNITVSDERYEYNGYRTIHVGGQALRLRKVKRTIE